MGDTLTLAAALLLGGAASGHCVAMCGGLSMALGLATARDARGRPRKDLLVAYQAGRMLSYALIGFAFAGAFAGLVMLLDDETLRRTLRVLSAVGLGLAAAVSFGRFRDPGNAIGRLVWPRLAPLGRRLLPVDSIPRALGFGMVWGWMPCGFVYTVLILASLQGDAIRGAATMLAFGLGTAPALLAVALGARSLERVVSRLPVRQLTGSLLLASAVLTLAGPWIVEWLPGMHGWLPYACAGDHAIH